MENSGDESKGNEKNAEEILKELSSKPGGNKMTKENRQLRNIFIAIGIFAVLIIAFVLIGKFATKFEYNGVKFQIVKEGELTFYNTKVPFYDKSVGHYRDYNFYLRNDARKLNVLFEGDIVFKKDLVINAESEEAIHCGGYGIISIANLKTLYEVLEIRVVKDPNSGCDELGRYMSINIKEGNETKIEQTGPSCYDIIINNCEILEGTEKFMIETIIQLNEELEQIG